MRGVVHIDYRFTHRTPFTYEITVSAASVGRVRLRRRIRLDGIIIDP